MQDRKFVSRHEDTGQNRNIRINNKPPENLAKLRDLKMTVANQTYARNEVKNSLNS